MAYIEEIWLPQIDKGVCIGCNDCIAICPTSALALESSTAVLDDPTACNYCGDCETICSVHAITLPYQVVLESDV